MLAEEGKEVSLATPEDACDVGSPLAKGICLNSIDGVDMGSVNWVWRGLGIEAVGPRAKAARAKAPRVNIAFGSSEDASLPEDVDACDTSADTLDRARCMGSFDPFSSTSSASWTLRSAKTAPAAKLQKEVNLGGLWGAKAANLAGDVDMCDLDGNDPISQALCLEHQDPLARGSAHWVLRGLANTAAAAPATQTQSTRGWFWKIWHTPNKTSPSAKDI
jgi:hypothetical protein